MSDKKYFVLMENNKIRAKYLRANNPVVRPLRLQPAATRASAYESVAPSVYTSLRAASRWWTNLLVDQLGSQTRSRRPTSRSKASSTFECCRAFAPSSNSLSCTTISFSLRREQDLQIHTRFITTCSSGARFAKPNDGLIKRTYDVHLSSGTRDAHPLRREAVTPNERTKNANATTKGGEAKSTSSC